MRLPREVVLKLLLQAKADVKRLRRVAAQPALSDKRRKNTAARLRVARQAAWALWRELPDNRARGGCLTPWGEW